MKRNIEYFHMESIGMGNRYFKVDFLNKRVIQIVLEKPNKNSGVHCVGIYFINIVSFYSTYEWRIRSKKDPLKYTTKTQFEAAKEQIIQKLS